MTEKNGAELLSDWLEREGRKKMWLAQKVATSQKTMGWWLSGRATPSPAHANHIETLTEGYCPASAWSKNNG